MGTRADFYVGKGKDAEWLGSIAWDGDPNGTPGEYGLLSATDESYYRSEVARMLDSESDTTKPERGWPWPWNDSHTSDYGYAFFDGAVWYSVGYPVDRWWRYLDGQPPSEEQDDYKPKMMQLERCEFPDMSARKNVRFDSSSGLVIISRKE